MVEGSKFSVAMLRRRMLVHEMHAAGFGVEDIGRRLELNSRQIARMLRLPKPKLRTPSRDHRWREFAACAGVDTNVFFPSAKGKASAAKKAAAIRICADCPVLDRCREDAFDNYESEGVWAGQDFSRIRYTYDEASGLVSVHVKESDGTLKKVS